MDREFGWGYFSVRYDRNIIFGEPYLNAQKKQRSQRSTRALTTARPNRRSNLVNDTLAKSGNWHAIEVTPTTWMLLLPEGPQQTIFEKAFASKTTLKLTKLQQDRLFAILQEAVEAGPGQPNEFSEVLTQRQLQIARMVSVGASNKAIARELGLTVGTVKVHLHRIYRMLGISGRVELAILVASK